MEQSPSWEANWLNLQLIKKFPAFYGTPKFITLITSARHLSLSWTNYPVPTTPSHFLKIHLNIILPSTSWSPQWSLSSGFPTKTLCTPLPSSICATCPAHLILLDFITRTILGEGYRDLQEWSAAGKVQEWNCRTRTESSTSKCGNNKYCGIHIW